jgi:hypothetical protein
LGVVYEFWRASKKKLRKKKSEGQMEVDGGILSLAQLAEQVESAARIGDAAVKELHSASQELDAAGGT